MNCAMSDQREKEMVMSRSANRLIMNQLTPGERFALMFGRGVIAYDPIRVIAKIEEGRESFEREDLCCACHT